MRDRVLEERLNQQEQLASASGSRLAALNTMETLFTPRLRIDWFQRRVTSAATLQVSSIRFRRLKPILQTTRCVKTCFPRLRSWPAIYPMQLPA